MARKSHFLPFFFCNPQIDCFVWEERQKSKFGGSWADLHQSLKIHNGLFFAFSILGLQEFWIIEINKNSALITGNQIHKCPSITEKWQIVWPLKLILARVINKIFRDSLSRTLCRYTYSRSIFTIQSVLEMENAI